jgi:hypothetical protein
MSTLAAANEIARKSEVSKKIIEDICLADLMEHHLVKIVRHILDMDVITQPDLIKLGMEISRKTLLTKIQAVDITPKSDIVDFRLLMPEKAPKYEWVKVISDSTSRSAAVFYHLMTTLVISFIGQVTEDRSHGRALILTHQILSTYSSGDSMLLKDIFSNMYGDAFYPIFMSTSSGLFRIAFIPNLYGNGHHYEWIKVVDLEMAYAPIPSIPNDFSLPGR